MSLATYSVRGLELAYWTWGQPTDPPLVLIHGFMDHARSFVPLVNALKEPRYVIAPDLRGHGHSGWIGAGGYYHFYDYFDDVRVLADQLQLQQFDLLGHSMGGSVAVGVAALWPQRVRRLVLLEGVGPPFDPPDGALNRLRTWADALPALNQDVAERRARRKTLKSVAEAAARLRTWNSRLSPERALLLAESFTEPQGDGVTWRFDPLHKTPAAKPYLFEEAQTLWRGVTAPVLSLLGAESPWVPDQLEARHQALRATVGYLEAAGHNLHHDQPEVLAAALEAFWRDESPFIDGVRVC